MLSVVRVAELDGFVFVAVKNYPQKAQLCFSLKWLVKM